MLIDNEIKLGFKDVLIKPRRSILTSRSEVDLTRTLKFKYAANDWTGIPVCNANMDTVGNFKLSTVLAKNNLLSFIHKHYSIDDWKKFISESSDDILENVVVSIGISDNEFDKLKQILALSNKLNKICIDVANGYTELFVNHIKKVRDFYPDHLIIAGNIVTAEIVEQLIISGADIIKVGIGPGSVCTTRVKTGVGFPQLSAVIECADAAHGLGGWIMSDGGCRNPGDISKSFGAGADFVMLGGLFSGHEESDGKIIEKNGKKYQEFYGMSSEEAMDKHSGGVASYRAAEGKKVQIPFKGTVQNTIYDILGGVRSTCTYVGAKKLKDLHKRTTFIRVNEEENKIFNNFESI